MSASNTMNQICPDCLSLHQNRERQVMLRMRVTINELVDILEMPYYRCANLPNELLIEPHDVTQRQDQPGMSPPPIPAFGWPLTQSSPTLEAPPLCSPYVAASSMMPIPSTSSWQPSPSTPAPLEVTTMAGSSGAPTLPTATIDLSSSSDEEEPQPDHSYDHEYGARGYQSLASTQSTWKQCKAKLSNAAHSVNKKISRIGHYASKKVSKFSKKFTAKVHSQSGWAVLEDEAQKHQDFVEKIMTLDEIEGRSTDSEFCSTQAGGSQGGNGSQAAADGQGAMYDFLSEPLDQWSVMAGLTTDSDPVCHLLNADLEKYGLKFEDSLE